MFTGDDGGDGESNEMIDVSKYERSNGGNVAVCDEVEF